MSERRFTRLKASLSETAAKTRETVSRELRQSLTANHESFLHCIDSDYEDSLRKLGQEFENDDLYEKFIVDNDDIEV